MDAFLIVLCLMWCVQLSVTWDHDDLLNTCLDADFHKRVPEPEPNLQGECAPWRDRACCEPESTATFHTNDVWLGFTWNHCPGHTLSDTCRRWFLKDTCFYECSPNTGPWIVEHVIRIRNERFLHAPFCQSQCSQWWEACKHEFTCWNIWAKGFNYSTESVYLGMGDMKHEFTCWNVCAKGFNYSTGINTCPTGTTCRPFLQVWKDSTTFCEQVWNYSWKVVPDSMPCFSLDFTAPNPNDAVAKFYLNSTHSAESARIRIDYALTPVICYQEINTCPPSTTCRPFLKVWKDYDVQ